MTTSIAMLGLGFFELALVAFILGGFAFWLWMIVDCISHETDPATKIAWLLVILLANVLGAPLYFFVRKLPRVSRHSPPPAYSR